MRQLRLRQRATGTQGSQPTPAQQEQGDDIVNLTTVEEEEAAATLLSMGIRKSPELDIPDDPSDGQLLQDADEVDEHNSLYREDQQPQSQRTSKIRKDMKAFFRRFAAKGEETQEQAISHGDDGSPSPSTRPTVYQPQANVSSPNHQRIYSQGNGQTSPILCTYDEDDVQPVAGDSIEVQEEARIGEEIDTTYQLDRNQQEDHAQLQPENEGLLDEDRSSRRSEDEESEISFVSEQIIDEEGEEASERTAERLFQQLQEGHHGCSEEQHEDKLREHTATEGDNHHRLREIYNRRRFPSVLSHDDIMPPTELEQGRLPSAVQWEEAFCGVPATGRQRLPMNICLHAEQTQAVEPQVAFDIDSTLGFWSSLAAAKQGLSYQPAAQSQQNIQTDIHLEMNGFENISEDDETVRACTRMLRDVPHFLIGRLCGAHNITVHVLFPHL